MAPRHRIVSLSSQDEIPPVASSDSSSSTDELSNKPLLINAENVDDTAREQHDIFNLVALAFVVAATLINWDLSKLHVGVDAAWTGNHFYLNWAVTVLYFLVDLIWVATVPACVKSPSTIIKHHIIAMAYLSGPILWPEYRWFMGACLSVEINTWFLIMRRVLYKQNSSELLRNATGLCFYVSWIVIRIFVYPGILVMFCLMAKQKIDSTGVLFHAPMAFIPIHLFLCILNLKWSYDLFWPMLTKSSKITNGL